jgi:uncharacterized membrane protein
MEKIMVRRKARYFVSAGLILLAASILVRNQMHSSYAEFAGGLLIGMSLVFIIAGTIMKIRSNQGNGKQEEKSTFSD